MGPARRMDGFGRAASPQARSAQPQSGQPQVRPRPVGAMPQPRPAQRPAVPQGYGRPAPQLSAQPQAAGAGGPTKPVKAPREKGGGGWKVLLQFVIGLVVIVAVACAIVWLYIRYYQ